MGRTHGCKLVFGVSDIPGIISILNPHCECVDCDRRRTEKVMTAE